MTQNDLKQCPYCAEFIKRDAVKCSYCGSMLAEQSQQPQNTAHWIRPQHDRVLAGICSGIARELNMPQLTIPLRLFFILTTLFWGFGPVFYIVLLLLMPGEKLKPSTQQFNASVTAPPPPPNHSLLYALVILGAMSIVFMLVVSGFNLRVPRLFGFHLPKFYIPHNMLFDIFPHGTFNFYPIPGPVILILALLVGIVLLSAFRLFRPALGCIGALLLGVVFFVILVPLLPILIVPLIFISIAFIIFGAIVLMVQVLRAILG